MKKSDTGALDYMTESWTVIKYMSDFKSRILKFKMEAEAQEKLLVQPMSIYIICVPYRAVGSILHLILGEPSGKCLKPRKIES